MYVEYVDVSGLFVMGECIQKLSSFEKGADALGLYSWAEGTRECVLAAKCSFLPSQERCSQQCISSSCRPKNLATLNMFADGTCEPSAGDPMRIIADIDGDGLGCLHWWDEDEDAEEDAGN
jgi:hypothetical protein